MVARWSVYQARQLSELTKVMESSTVPLFLYQVELLQVQIVIIAIWAKVFSVAFADFCFFFLFFFSVL